MVPVTAPAPGMMGMNMSMGVMPPQSSSIEGVPSRVIKLGNMVTHNELLDDSEYADIMEDIRLECADQAPVEQVVIPRIKDGFPPHIEPSVFVQFSTVDGARKAAEALNGRKFSDKTIIVCYYDEMAFHAGQRI